MTRVSTLNSYENALANLMKAQGRLRDANNQVSSEKVATDSKGFGRSSETLTAMRSSQSRLQGFIQTAEALQQRLDTQNLALERLGESAQGARQAIAEALANGRGDALMTEIQGRFSEAVEALNTKHQGRYLFSGAQVDTAPFDAQTLGDLTVPADVGDLFLNDAQKSTSRLDENSSITTGFLADELGEDLMEVFRAVQQLHTGPSGPIQGQLTAAQKTALSAAMDQFDTARRGIVDNTARNGALQNRVDQTLEAQEDQADSLEVMIGKRTDVDMAEALTRLQMAEFAVQASSQVVAGLRNASLLEYLR